MIKIRYAQIRECDVSNGDGIGVSLFVQGCQFRCPNCFNKDTWDFNDGKEWTQEINDEFIKLVSRPYIKRVSVLGGEPLADENLDGVLNLVNKIRILFPNKTIWIYSGYTWEQIMSPVVTDDFNLQRDEIIHKRREIISKCDILVDGRYIDSQRDITLKWRGSSNQRVINIQESLKKDEIVLWTN